MDHPLWKHFDIVFKTLTPRPPTAARRRCACCAPAAASCRILTCISRPAPIATCLKTAKLGFNQQLMLGHNGLFGDFLKELRSLGGMQSPLMDQTGLPVSLQAFDGSPVYEDLAVLNRWLKTEEASSNPRNATFYNTLPLHDGNHFPGQSKTADYKVRAQKLFDDRITSSPSWRNRGGK